METQWFHYSERHTVVKRIQKTPSCTEQRGNKHKRFGIPFYDVSIPPHEQKEGYWNQEAGDAF